MRHVSFKQHFKEDAVSTGAQEIASHRSSGENWVSTRYMEDTFLDQSGTLGSHQSSLKTGFHPPGHSSYYKMASQQETSWNLYQVAKQILRVQLWALREAAIDPDKPKEGHLKGLPHPWMTEVQGGGQSEERHSFKPKSYKSHEQNRPLERITPVNDHARPQAPQQARLTKKKKKKKINTPAPLAYGFRVSETALHSGEESWCFTNCYTHRQ